MEKNPILISRSQEDGGNGVSWFGGGGRTSYVVMIWAEQRDRKRQIEELKPNKKSIVITMTSKQHQPKYFAGS